MKTRLMRLLTAGITFAAAASATWRTFGAQEFLLPYGADDALQPHVQRAAQEQISKRSARAEVSKRLAAYDFVTARQPIEPVA